MTNSTYQRGATMIEALLGVMVAVAFFALSVPWMVQASRDMRAKNVAEQEQSFMQAASQYYLANTTGMLAAMADGTGAPLHCQVRAITSTGLSGTVTNDTALHTCALDVNWLIYKNYLPATFKATNAYGQRLVAIFRRIYDASSVATANAEMLMVGAYEDANTMGVPTYDELTTTAEILGGNGGVMPDMDRGACKAIRSSSTYQVCGQGGGWKVDLSKFVSSAQLSTFAAGLPN